MKYRYQVHAETTKNGHPTVRSMGPYYSESEARRVYRMQCRVCSRVVLFRFAGSVGTEIDRKGHRGPLGR